MAQVTGRVFIKIKGRTYPSKEGAKLNFAGITRDMVTSDVKVEGYKEKIEAPSVSCTFVHSASLSLADIRNIVDETLSYTTDTGRSYVLSGACCTKALELASGDLSVEFGAIDCVEV
jgi:hypothetical protein